MLLLLLSCRLWTRIRRLASPRRWGRRGPRAGGPGKGIYEGREEESRN